MDLFEMPKVELHAHLNGSLSDETLLELHRHKYGHAKCSSDKYTIDEFAKELSMAECFEKFKFAHDLTDTPERLSIATKRVIRDFANQNTIYLELRSTPRTTPHMSKRDYIDVICETILKTREEEEQRILVRYLPSVDRAKSVQENEDTLSVVLAALESKERYRNIIVGLDLSGNPAVGSFTDLKPILTKARNFGLKLAIHCAEISGQTEETKEILESGLVDRIGHGTFLDETPELWSLFVTKGLLVECCLTSNVKCGTVAEYESHHLQKLIRINNPLAICTDDYGVFGTDITQEFETAQEVFQLHQNDLERISRDSVSHSFCEDSEKEDLWKKIRAYFLGLKEL